MNINITKQVCKSILDNPANTEMERILAQYAIRLHDRIGKCENDANDLKNVIKGITATILNSCPWLIQQEAKNHGFKLVKDDNAGVYTTPQEIAEKMFPMSNPPFNGDSSSENQ